jgi:hypothetical protein
MFLFYCDVMARYAALEGLRGSNKSISFFPEIPWLALYAIKGLTVEQSVQNEVNTEAVIKRQRS